MSETLSASDIARVELPLMNLVGVQFDVLSIPGSILAGFEPSQIGTIVGTLMDACIPQLAEILPEDETLREVGLVKSPGILGEREGYPDFEHPASGLRAELKLLYVDPSPGVRMKRPPTPREPSARLTQKVTLKNVDPATDVLLVVAYQLQGGHRAPERYSPTIVDVGVFPMIECIRARDARLARAGGVWFGDYETPTVLSRVGKAKLSKGLELDRSTYGRKESEGRDFNEDTNFGKLKRIPYEDLQRFLKKHGAAYAGRGEYPAPWAIDPAAPLEIVA